MITRSAILAAIKAALPFVKEKAKSLAYSLAKKHLRILAVKFVKSLEGHQALNGVDLPDEKIADYIVSVLLGETIPVKERYKAGQIADIIRCAISK